MGTIEGRPTPSRRFDQRVTVASSLHASPGTFAILLGSGVSTGAGIPTGWSVATDLAVRAAALQFPDDPGQTEAARTDPARWWAEHGEDDFGYSTLLKSLAPTAGARQALLAPYFEPTEEDRQAGLKVPGPAHQAIARLVQRGFVRVIVTTNFDRLMERALEEQGLSPQVIHRTNQIDASTPLAHARVTVVKLHGDYADLDQRNTIDELSAYPPELTAFLARVIDEYGLIVCGWSGDWDRALVAALEDSRSRRYPMAWASLNELSEPGRRLVAQHDAVVISGVTADDFFTDLDRRLDALDRLNEPPVSRDTAIVRLKRALADPTRRIELWDILDDATNAVVAAVSDIERFPLGGANYEAQVDSYRAELDTLMHLLGHGVFHDDGTYDSLWVRSVQRLLDVRGSFSGGFNDALESLRHLPALLAVWTIGVSSIASHREGALAAVQAGPSWRSMFGDQHLQDVGDCLNPNRVLDSGGVNAFPRWRGQKWSYGPSHYLREACREPVRAIVPDDDEYRRACDRLEYLMSMTQLRAGETTRFRHPWAGEAMLREWGGPSRRELGVQIRSELSSSWPFIAAGVFRDEDDAKAAVEQLEEWISRNPKW